MRFAHEFQFDDDGRLFLADKVVIDDAGLREAVEQVEGIRKAVCRCADRGIRIGTA